MRTRSRFLSLVALAATATSCGLVLDFDQFEDGGGAASPSVNASTGSHVGPTSTSNDATSSGETTSSVTTSSASSGGGALPLGASCGDGTMCESGFCADNVCCDAVCDGPCRSCGADGGCIEAPQSTECGAGPCTAGVLQLPSTCTSSGECVSGTTVPCASGCDGAVCAGCSPGSCGPGTFCPPQGGACVAKLALGAACNTSDACTSGHCIDGVCCDQACNGTCQACGATGVCTTHASGDPENECPQDAGCGRTGVCAGTAPACALAGGTVTCGSPSCVGAMSFPAAVCNGAGACGTATGSTCPGGYTCDSAGVACRTACAASGHCAAGNICVNAVCVPDGSNGDTCSVNGDCTSNNCLDGHCCAATCGGGCKTCDVNGACVPVGDGIPNNTCFALGECQLGYCVAGECAIAAEGSPCAGQCSNSSLVHRECNAVGVCVEESSESCPEQCCYDQGVAGCHSFDWPSCGPEH